MRFWLLGKYINDNYLKRKDAAEWLNALIVKNEVSLMSAQKDESSEVHKEVEGIIKKEVMYSCPHCDKILGFAFFLGGVATGRP